MILIAYKKAELRPKKGEKGVNKDDKVWMFCVPDFVSFLQKVEQN